MSNYSTKTDSKNATGVNALDFAKNTDLANFKSNVDNDKLKNLPSNLSNLISKGNKLDFDKLVPAPVDLSKLRDFVRDDIVKKEVYNGKILKIKYLILLT